LDILHQLELGAGCVDLRDRARCQFVDEMTKDLSVTKGILVGGLEFFAQNLFDPLLSFALLLWVALGEDL
jgi:hypothetical protein